MGNQLTHMPMSQQKTLDNIRGKKYPKYKIYHHGFMSILTLAVAEGKEFL